MALSLKEGVISEAFDVGFDTMRNYFGAQIQKGMTEWYMDEYGSPQAQMRNMTEAGINPFAAAGSVSGVSGSAPSVPTTAASNVADSASKIADSNLNPDVASNTKADTDVKKETAQGLSYENVVSGASVNADIVKRAADAGISSYTASMLGYKAERYPEFFTYEMNELDSKIRMNGAQTYLYDKQKEYYSYLEQEITYNIKAIKSTISLNMSEKEKNETIAYLNRLQGEATYWGIKRAEIEVQRYKDYDELPPWQKVYYDIEKEQGHEAAEAWKQANFDMVKDYNEKVAIGQANGMPQVREMNSTLDIRDNAQNLADEALNTLREYNDWYKDHKDQMTEEEKREFMDHVRQLRDAYNFANDMYKDAENLWHKMSKDYNVRKTTAQKVGEYTSLIKDIGIGIGAVRAGSKLSGTTTTKTNRVDMPGKSGFPENVTTTEMEYHYTK